MIYTEEKKLGNFLFTFFACIGADWMPGKGCSGACGGCGTKFRKGSRGRTTICIRNIIEEEQLFVSRPNMETELGFYHPLTWQSRRTVFQIISSPLPCDNPPARQCPHRDRSRVPRPTAGDELKQVTLKEIH